MTQKLLFAALLVAALLALPAAVSAYDNELSVEVTEQIDVTAESDGAYTWNYDVTGGNFSLIVTNEQGSVTTGDADTRLMDIWVPFDDHIVDANTHLLSSAVCNFETNDTSLEANPCAVQVCAIAGPPSQPMTLTGCYCLDIYWESITSGTSIGALDATRTAALYYNPDVNGTNPIGDFKYVLHINELQGDTYVNLSCALDADHLDGIDLPYPITFNETFSPKKIINEACTAVTVNLTLVSNSSCALAGTVQKALSPNAAGTWTNLNFSSAPGGTTSTDFKRTNWTLSLAAGGTQTITFVVNACPNMTGNTSKLEMGKVYVAFDNSDDTCMNNTFWNLTIGHVTAVGPAEVNVSKEHIKDTGNWVENSTFYNSATDLNYTIYRFRLWAENGTDPSTVDPNTAAAFGSDHNCSGLPDNISHGGTFTCDGKTFTADDIPVIFGQPVFELIEGGISGWDDYHTFENSKNASAPLGSDYFLIENIWVINGYLVKASKTVTPYSGEPGCYNVSIEVKNLGVTCSPYLYVYDIVPEEFYNMTGSAISDLTSPWDIMVSAGGTNATIAKPGNAQGLTALGLYDITTAYLLAYATPPVITENWTLGNFVDTFNDSQYTGKKTGLTGTYAGTGYRWELFPMSGTGSAGDDECPGDVYGNLGVTSSDVVYITYSICADEANMTYYPSELFIVGVDPINVDGAASPLASVGFGSGEKSGEPLLMVFLAVLAVIAAALFVKRQRA